MKKLILAALMAALIMTAAVAPAFAEDITETLPEAEITEPVTEAETEAITETEPATEPETETDAETEAETEPETEPVTEPETETEEETEAVDGALVEKDYLTRMMEGLSKWLADNPELVGTITTGAGVLAAAFLEVLSSKKARKRIETKSEDMTSKAILLNNNAVEMVEEAKKSVSACQEGMEKVARNVSDNMTRITEDVLAELHANRMETRANSVILAELIKDARLPTKRKEEILELYNKELAGEVSEDEKHDEA